jgi:two-component system, NtrC family, response regulator GlrR
MNPRTVLLLDLDHTAPLSSSLQQILAPALSEEYDFHHTWITSGNFDDRDAEVRSILSQLTPMLVFLALPRSAQPVESFGSLFDLLSAPVIVAGEHIEPKEMLKLLELGASDFVGAPLSPLNVLPRMWRMLEQSRERDEVKHSLKQKLGLKHLIGKSAAFVAEVNRIPVVARSDVTVLILGETGTGKELFARAIHYLGPRAAKPFVPVNCGAIPADLVENELFGHERGAYTSASSSKTGLVAEADGGTLFLDEIDCLSLMAQVKLLRFIQEKEYRALGSTRTRRADLRIVAASNTDLRAAVRNGSMRHDLYYRLNIIPFSLPPLRERREDIPLLATRFLSKYAAEFDKQFDGFAPEALRALLAYDWPGNVRELEHVIERAVVLAQRQVILEKDILLQSEAMQEGSFQEAKARMIEHFEKTYISGLLVAHDGNITRAAEAARKNRRAFFELMRKHKIKGRTFKASA